MRGRSAMRLVHRLPFLLPAPARQALGIGTPGALCSRTARDEIAAYRAAVAARLGVPAASLLAVGHRGGNSTRYPGGAYEPRDLGAAWDVAVLMERSFEILGLDGIEVDLRLDAAGIVSGDQAVYICHDPIGAGTPRALLDWLPANSLERVLGAFIARGYARDRHLFLEVKCARARTLAAGGAEDVAIRRALETVDRAIASAGAAVAAAGGEASVRRHISFVSFNFAALEAIARRARGAGAGGGGPHDLYLLLATNRATHRLLMAFFADLRELSYLDRALRGWLARTRILAGVWLDPATIPDFGPVLAGIRRRRAAAAGLPPLRVFLSTYKAAKADFLRALEGPPAAAGLIFDIAE